MERPLKLRVDLSAATPVYRQIADSLRAHLVEGRLQPEDTLPPVRELALDLGINFNTVAEAYRILAEEGWLDLKRRRGARVLARSVPAADGAAEQQFARKLRELIAQARSSGVPLKGIVRELNSLLKGLQS